MITLSVAACLFLLLAQHPFVTYPLSLRLFGRWWPAPAIEPGTPGLVPAEDSRIAICMCAYNEESVIGAKMENLLALRAQEPGLEILVYVDAASDRTAEILQAYADRITLHVSPRRYGKTHGMNLLVAQATAPLLVFTDANVILAEDCLQRLRPYFDDPSVGCVCGHLIYTNGEESVTAASGSFYWRLEEATKKLEEKTGSVMGADGSLFAVRRELHQSPPDHIIDDMYVSLMILCQGYRVVQATDVRAYEASASSATDEFKRKVRIACQAFNVHRLLWPLLSVQDGMTRYKYVSHKLLRWLTIYSLALSLLCFMAALIVAEQGALALALGGLMLLGFALGHRGVKPFSQLTDILLAFVGTGLGVWRSLRGERFQTWSPAASVRRS